MFNRRRLIVPVLTALATSAALFAQAPATTSSTGPAPTPAASAPAPSELKIALMDGSLVTGKISVAELSIQTKFGLLKVPFDDIQSFAPGLESHPKFSAALSASINDLGADAFADREKAQAELMKLGPNIRSDLERELKTAEAEKQVRLQKIIEDFETQQPEDEGGGLHQWVEDDVIVTPGFTVVGHITTPAFSVSSSYGTLQLKLEDIREGHRDVSEPEEIHKNVTVTGLAISQRQFTSTGIRLERGDRVSITASGTIQLTPWGNNAQATPDGSTNNNLGVMQPGNLQGGSLIGRIGDGAPPFHVGSKATITADRAGVLQLGIAVGGLFVVSISR